MDIQKRIDAAATLEEYRALTDEVKALFANKVGNEPTIFIAALALSFNSKRLQNDQELRNLARRTALFAFNHVREWMIENANDEEDVRFIRSHLINMVPDYRNEHMLKPEPYLWGTLLSMCVQKLIGLRAVEGCTAILRLLDELGMQVPGFGEEEREQIRDLEFAKRHVHQLVDIVAFMERNGINTDKTSICIVTNETYESYTLALQGEHPGNQDIPNSETYIGKLHDANDNNTATTRKVWYGKEDKIFYVYRNKQKHPVVPNVLAYELTKAIEARIHGDRGDREDREDALEMQKRVAELQERDTGNNI